VDESSFSTTESGTEGQRKFGDSLVGLPGRSPYNAAHDKLAEAYFEAKHRPGSSASNKSLDWILHVKGLELDTIK
jgi:hypothetical protein